jgi:hypothetical protein
MLAMALPVLAYPETANGDLQNDIVLLPVIA